MISEDPLLWLLQYFTVILSPGPGNSEPDPVLHFAWSCDQEATVSRLHYSEVAAVVGQGLLN